MKLLRECVALRKISKNVVKCGCRNTGEGWSEEWRTGGEPKKENENGRQNNQSKVKTSSEAISTDVKDENNGNA